MNYKVYYSILRIVANFILERKYWKVILLNMQNLFFSILFVFLFTQCSSIQYVNSSPDFENAIGTTKRILILPAQENKISKEENAMLHDILRQEISHHSLFIVYKAPAKFKNVCSKDFPKIEGIFTAKMNEVPEGNKSSFELTGSLQKCSTGKTLWEAKAINKFTLEANENMSLIKTYSERYGEKVSNKVNAYFQLSKDLIEKLKGPDKLNEEEELEKIEVESE